MLIRRLSGGVRVLIIDACAYSLKYCFVMLLFFWGLNGCVGLIFFLVIDKLFFILLLRVRPEA